MKVNRIISKRGYRKESSWHLVYEWEDIIANKLGLQIKNDTKSSLWIKEQCNKLRLTSIYNVFKSKKNLSLLYIMTVSVEKDCELNRSVIPIIIDFWLKEEELPIFYETYKNVPLILISSAEVFEFLKSKNCPLKIHHWPLSYPDKYRITGIEHFEKKWDLVLIGRNNPFFIRFLDKYCETHPEFIYVYGTADINNRQFMTNKGVYVGDAIGRENYLSMVKSAKIVFYSTPGCDEAKEGANGYNQVTPRFFECLSNGCLIMAHYTKNPDTDYYDLPSFSDDISTYERFESELNRLRQIPSPSMKLYSDYLLFHYTSTRIPMLNNILEKQNIFV